MEAFSKKTQKAFLSSVLKKIINPKIPNPMKFIKTLVVLLTSMYLLTWAITQNPNPFTYNKLQLILFAIAVFYSVIISVAFSINLSKKTTKKQKR